MNQIPYLLLLLKITVIFSSDLPIKPCRLEDLECLKASAQAVVPVFTSGLTGSGIEPLDPMHVDNIKFNLAGLDMDVKDVMITGLTDSKIEKLSVDTSAKNIHLSFLTDVWLKGDYKCSGKILALPIYGNGLMAVRITKIQIDIVMPFEVIKNANGKDAINLKSSSFTYEVFGSVHFDLTNLFDGNKQLSDVILKAINENWKELADLFGSTILEKPVSIIAKSIKKWLRSQALQDIAIL